MWTAAVWANWDSSAQLRVYRGAHLSNAVCQVRALEPERSTQKVQFAD